MGQRRARHRTTDAFAGGRTGSRADATAVLRRFTAKYDKKYPTAVAGLTQGRDALLAFYDLPIEDWVHLRTINSTEAP